MPSLLARLILFLSSYAPLLLLFASLDSFGSEWSRLLCLVVAVASLIALLIYWRSIRSEPSAYKTTEIKSAAPRNLDVIGYFVSYVIPFAAAQESDIAGRLSLLFLFVVIAGFYFRNDLYYANPVLALAGIRVFDVVLESNDQPILVLTHRRFLKQHTDLDLRRLGTYIYVDRKS
jgi:hypothetical protein